MMNKLKITLALVLLLIFVTGSAGHAGSPPLPASFYGTVTLDNVNVPAGTLVSAWINGVKYAEASTTLADGASVYLLDVPGDDPDTPEIEGGRDGEIVVFEVAGYDVDQTARWFNGTHRRLDLTTTTGPDLVVTAINLNAVTTDPQTLIAGGTGRATIRNQGRADVPADATFAVTFFEDRDGDGAYDSATDNTLGEVTYTGGLAYGAEAEVQVLVTGEVRFRDNLIYAFVDSKNVVGERNERNNLNHSGNRCEFWPPVGQFNPVLEWEWTDSTILPGFNRVRSTPAVIDLTADGIPDIVFITYEDGISYKDGHLRAISGRDGSEIFTVTDPEYDLQPVSHIAVGDIDLDGRPEIVGVDEAERSVIAFEHDGTFKWRTEPLPEPAYLAFGTPAVADLDGDGTPEIVVLDVVWNNDGALRWRGSESYVGDASVVANLDLSGDPEVVLPRIAYRSDGSVYWVNKTDLDHHYIYNAVGDFDDDPFPEIVVVSRSFGETVMLEHDGTLKWGPVNRPGAWGGPPAVGDVDGDGESEIGVAGRFAYDVLEGDGTLKWSVPHSQWAIYGERGSAMFDFDGDGAAEIVYRDDSNIRILRGTDGAVLWEHPYPLPGSHQVVIQTPVIADVDADGNAELVMANAAMGVTAKPSDPVGIHVFGDANDTWVPTRQVWNQHSYHINNVNDDGTIPAEETNSWEDHNTYRSNLQHDLYRAPDLTASRLLFDTTGLPDTLRITARIGNGGSLHVAAGLPVAFYDGNPVTGGTLLGTVQTTKMLNPGEYEDVTFTWPSPPLGDFDIYVVADADDTGAGTQNECDETNNTHHQTVDTNVIGPDLVVPAVDPSGTRTDSQALTIVGDLAVQLQNQGNLDVTTPFQVTLFEDTDGDAAFTARVDNVLGQRTYFGTGTLAVGQSVWLPIAVSGSVLFRDNLIYAFADSQDVIAELDENNNLNQTGASCQYLPPVGDPFSTPDLTASYIRVDVGDYPTSVTFTVRIGNGGAVAAAAGVPVAFYDGDPNDGGTLLGTVQTTKALNPGDYEDVAFTWNTPGLGLQTVYVVADDDGTGTGTQNECDETNNTHWLSYITGPVGPDLIVPLVDAGDTSTDPQTLIIEGTVTAQIANQGSTAAIGDFDVTFFEDLDGDNAFTPGADNVLGQATHSGGLAPGATVTVEATVTGQVQFLGSPLWAFADSSDAIPELDETNNVNHTATQCQVNSLPAPDLTLSHLRGEPAPPVVIASAAKQSPPSQQEIASAQKARLAMTHGVDLTVRVGNGGTAPVAPGVGVDFYLGDPAAGGTLLGSTATSDTLPPGGFEDVTIRWTDETTGTHEVFVTVDAIGECDEANNAYQQTLSILDIPLVESWNLISGWVNPHNTDIGVVQRPISGTYVVIQGFDQGGQSYYPDVPAEVNTLKEMDAEHGYWVKVKAEEQGSKGAGEMSSPLHLSTLAPLHTLRLVGTAFPENRELVLDSDWNLVSFLSRNQMGVVEGLRSIDGQYTAVLGFEQGALSYYPHLEPHFNTLWALQPLHGYWIRMAQVETLRYPRTQPGGAGAAGLIGGDPDAERRARLARQAEQATGVHPTNTWVNFYGLAWVDGEPVPEGALVQVFDADGVVCGAGVVSEPGRYGLLACYGDDLTTSEDEGASPGDVLTFTINGQPTIVSWEAVWTAHGDLIEVNLKAEVVTQPWQLYLPLVRKGDR